MARKKIKWTKFAHGRQSGHIQAREGITDWEQFWVAAHAAEGFGYRQIAALVYGVAESRVTNEERERVGRIARAAGCGCNSYRTMRNDEARTRIRHIHQVERQAKPPLLSKLRLAAK